VKKSDQGRACNTLAIGSVVDRGRDKGTKDYRKFFPMVSEKTVKIRESRGKKEGKKRL